MVVDATRVIAQGLGVGFEIVDGSKHSRDGGTSIWRRASNDVRSNARVFEDGGFATEMDEESLYGLNNWSVRIRGEFRKNLLVKKSCYLMRQRLIPSPITYAIKLLVAA